MATDENGRSIDSINILRIGVGGAIAAELIWLALNMLNVI